MCDWCEEDTTLILKSIIDDYLIGWDKELKATDLNYKTLTVILDKRGCIKLVDPEDCNCLDHGQKVKINYCPKCGREF